MSGKTAYVNGEKITGTISSYTGSSLIIPGVEDKVLSTAEGIYLPKAVKVAGDANLLGENIKSGVSIYGIVGTLESSGGTSAGYYKCASVTPGVSGAVIEVTGDTAYGCNGTYTIVDATATGKNRTWRTSDGVWEIRNTNATAGIDRWCIFDVASDTMKIRSVMTTVPDNPWEVTSWQNNTSPYAYPDLVLTPYDTAKTWSGYKAVWGDNGYTISDDLTEGLVYSGMTPQVGMIYDSTCSVRVAVLYSSLAVEPALPVFYVPLMTDNSIEINPGSITTGNEGNVSFSTVDGVPTAVLNSGYLHWDKDSTLPNGNHEISISFGLRLTQTMENKLIFFYGSNDGYNGLGLQVNGTSITMSTKEGNSLIGVTQELQLDTWYHILVTYTTDGMCKLYINGTLKTSASKSLTLSSSYSFNFGNYTWSGSWRNLYACITRARIYDYAIDDTYNIAWLMQEIGVS